MTGNGYITLLTRWAICD